LTSFFFTKKVYFFTKGFSILSDYLSMANISSLSLKFLASLGINEIPENFERTDILGTASPKTIKGEKYGYLTGIVYLTPADKSGLGNLCAWAGKCKTPCLDTAGRGAMSNVQKGRLRKTSLFFKDQKSFMINLVLDIRALEQKAKKIGMIPVCRPNGTSDSAFHRIAVGDSGKTLMVLFPSVQFYDYTKSIKKSLDNAKGLHAKNYHVTFSRDSEQNEEDCVLALKNKANVAVVFRTANFPTTWKGFPTVDGDDSDLRFLDPKGGYVIALKAKGKAKKDNSGFVID
jgi:hypothetical protein